MSSRPSPKPENMPRLSPYLLCEDVEAEVEFLARAFGFEEDAARRVRRDPEGPIVHTEMRYRDAVVLMGHPGPQYRNPKHSGGAKSMLYVYVDDVDAHFEHARAEGATILEEVQDVFYGDRRYAAQDVEGHQWNFATQVKETKPSDWNPSHGG